MGINIQTNQNVLINYKLCSIGSRIVAYIIDSLVITGIIIILSFASSLGIIAPKKGADFFLTIFFIPVFFYHLLSELTMNGQSIGKRAQNIRVIKADGRQATISSYLLRFLLRPIDSIYAIGLAFIFFTSKNQRLGDLAAGTILVDVSEKYSISNFIQTKTIDKSQISFHEVNLLKDKDITLIENILKKRRNQPDHENINLLAIKIKDYLKVRSDYPDYQFLQKIVTDFYAYYAD